jgi:hypothetical protein
MGGGGGVMGSQPMSTLYTGDQYTGDLTPYLTYGYKSYNLDFSVM